MDADPRKVTSLEFFCINCGDPQTGETGREVICSSCGTTTLPPAAGSTPPSTIPSQREEILKFFCTSCGQKLSSPRGFAGREFDCPNCAITNVVPGEVGPPAQADDSEELLKFFCNCCGQKLSCEAELAGKTIACPVCLDATTVPAEAPKSNSSPPAAKHPSPPAPSSSAPPTAPSSPAPPEAPSKSGTLSGKTAAPLPPDPPSVPAPESNPPPPAETRRPVPPLPLERPKTNVRRKNRIPRLWGPKSTDQTASPSEKHEQMFLLEDERPEEQSDGSPKGTKEVKDAGVPPPSPLKEVRPIPSGKQLPPPSRPVAGSGDSCELPGGDPVPNRAAEDPAEGRKSHPEMDRKGAEPIRFTNPLNDHDRTILPRPTKQRPDGNEKEPGNPKPIPLDLSPEGAKQPSLPAPKASVGEKLPSQISGLMDDAKKESNDDPFGAPLDTDLEIENRSAPRDKASPRNTKR